MSNQIAAIPLLRVEVCNGNEMPPLLTAALFNNKGGCALLHGDATPALFYFYFIFVLFQLFILFLEVGRGGLRVGSHVNSPSRSCTTNNTIPPAQQRVSSGSSTFCFLRMKNPAEWMKGGVSSSFFRGGWVSGGGVLRAAELSVTNLFAVWACCAYMNLGSPYPKKHLWRMCTSFAPAVGTGMWKSARV